MCYRDIGHELGRSIQVSGVIYLPQHMCFLHKFFDVLN